MSHGIWVIDPESGMERFVAYDEVDDDIWQQLVKPVGGFVWRVDDFLTLRLTRSPFYVQSWVPKRGKAVLYAPPKVGKSLLVMQLARCVGSGHPFLGLPTNQTRVLYLQFELDERVVQLRCLNTGQRYDNVFIGTSFSLQIDTPQGQEQLLTAMKAVGPGLLILDPLYKTMSGDENESTDMKAITNTLDRLIEAFDCSVLLVHHSGKDVSRRGRGSSVLEGWVDSLIEMRRCSGDKERLRITLTPKMLRHAELPPEPITAELTNRLEFSAEGVTTVTVYTQVYNFFHDNPTLDITPELLFENLNGGSNTSVHESLTRLVEEGFVEKIRKGHYRWKSASN